MTDQEINIAIAEACPTVFQEEDGVVFWHYMHQKAGQCVSPVNDLNAMREAINTRILNGNELEWTRYNEWLEKICGGYHWEAANATARQRAEAVLRTLNKWKETNEPRLP